jgi:DNA modification methylase
MENCNTEINFSQNGQSEFLFSDSIDDISKIDINNPISQIGDLWQLGEHRVLCGDSTKKEDVEKLMNGKKCDMIFTDPPYSVNYTKKNKEIFKSQEYSNIENDDLSVNDISNDLWFPAFKNMFDFSNDDCSYYMTMCQGGDQMMMMMMMMMKSGWKLKHELIWIKDNPVFSTGRLNYDYQHEPILFGWKKTHNFYGKGHFKKSIWQIKRDGNKSHPTMKPVKLIENAILNSSLERNIVLDMFLGSGSTLIACEKTNRICYGVEIDPHYVDVILQRYVDFTDKNPIRLNDNKSWKELKMDVK